MLTVPGTGTLLTLICVFGVIGAMRGATHEVWTMCGVALTVFFLAFGGQSVAQQLIVRLWAALLALTGQQSASDRAASDVWKAPATNVMLWLVAAGLLALAFLLGNIGRKKDEKSSFGTASGGFLVGAVNGVLVGILLFSPSVLQGGVIVQFPDQILTTNSFITVFVIVVIVAAGVAVASLRSKPKAAS